MPKAKKNCHCGKCEIEDFEIHFRNVKGEKIDLSDVYASIIGIQEGLKGLVLAVNMFFSRVEDKMDGPEQGFLAHLLRSLESCHRDLDRAAPSVPCTVEYRPKVALKLAANCEREE
jgi:hypothetical protein